MGYVIAIAGKGGTGKTTLAGLLVRLIKEKNLGSILAIDADPNSNLAEVLGVTVKESIGSILDEVAAGLDKIPAGMPKDRFIEYRISTAIQEGAGFDVLVMGRPEGPGCYCYVNNVLRNIVSKLIKDYAYIIIDNEAGLEHLSRRTSRAADTMVVISDATAVGLKAAERISTLVEEMQIKVRKKILLINRFNEKMDREKLKSLRLEYLGNIPEDPGIERLSLNGNSLMQLKDDSPALRALSALGEKIWH